MENLLYEFNEILEESVITESCNCLYNRSALIFIKVNERNIDRKIAISLVQISMTILKNGSTDEGIYKSLTILKIIGNLLEKFRADCNFIKTSLLKLIELRRETDNLSKDNLSLNKLSVDKKIKNTNRVLENIVQQFQFKINNLNTNAEILALARSLPS